MPLTKKMKQDLKAKAHKLKPVVQIGSKGLTEQVNKEIDIALNAHELIKIQIQANDRDEKRDIYSQICETNSAEAVQLIGHIGVVYRKKKD